jgi:5-methylcytosine-specific restriction endonuclease McrA
LVIKVGRPSKKSLTSFDEVYKERTRLKYFYTRIHKDWRQQFKLYVEVKGNPEKIKCLDINKYVNTTNDSILRKDTLINLFSPTKNKKPYDAIEKIRHGHGLLVCPSCGQVTVPNTVDHYLPKKHFPELSTLLLNLTPMCSQCQSEKGDGYLNEDGKKKFIHPYFDQVNKPLYKIKFNPPYERPRFEIKFEEMEPDLARLIRDHLQGLGFEHRYPKFLKTKYLHLLKTAEKYRLRKKENRLVEVFDDRKDAAEDKGYNCWEAVFYRSVLADEELVEYLIQGELPGYL